jgi:hypothetical protein
VIGLAFDPAGGTMTVEFDPGATGPAALARRVTERAGMRAEPLGSPEALPDGRSVGAARPLGRHGRLGAVLAVGAALSWAGAPAEAARIATCWRSGREGSSWPRRR